MVQLRLLASLVQAQPIACPWYASCRDQKFVYDVMLARIYNANSKIKSENLTAGEDKRAVYSAEYRVAQGKLADKFGAKMARKMMTLSNEARKKAEKK